ncbi:hypothetical protein ACFQ15_17020 [Sphingomonas hankookensis]|uniref:hypothetical protein n=1 Tax=Sphingomonas hankookensis TaxID=563996 RepID=UPI001F59D522|nr:hypothetical protein [Sphingomonas hankookensis]
MKSVVSSGIVIAAMLGGCDRADPIERLRAEVAMPACPGAKVERLPPVAGLEADYAVKVTAATAACRGGRPLWPDLTTIIAKASRYSVVAMTRRAGMRLQWRRSASSLLIALWWS